MSVCVVSCYPLLQPDNFPCPQILFEIALDLLLIQAWVAIAIEEALLCGQDRPRAVHIDGSALQDYSWNEALHLEVVIYQTGDSGVSHQSGILFPPGIEGPGDHSDIIHSLVFPPRYYECWAIIPEPDIRIIYLVESDPKQLHLLLSQPLNNSAEHHLVSDQEVDHLALMHGFDDGDVCVLHFFYIEECLLIIGPGEPYRFMLFPFCRHMKAQLQGRIHQAESILPIDLFHHRLSCLYLRGRLFDHLDDGPVKIRPAIAEKAPSLPDRLVFGQIQVSQ